MMKCNKQQLVDKMTPLKAKGLSFDKATARLHRDGVRTSRGLKLSRKNAYVYWSKANAAAKNKVSKKAPETEKTVRRSVPIVKDLAQEIKEWDQAGLRDSNMELAKLVLRSRTFSDASKVLLIAELLGA